MIKNINDIDTKLLEDDDRIEAYLKGQLSTEEEQKFLKDLEENPKLKEKAIVTARLVKGLKQVGLQQDQDIGDVFLSSSQDSVENAAKEAIKKACTSSETTTKTVSMRKTSKWLAIAASLVFVVWLGFEYNDYRHTTGLGEEYGDSFSSSMIVRGADSPIDAEKKLEVLVHSSGR